jgi:hypothetical protein
VENREMPKLLVIDKNRFQGIPPVLLLEFVKNYRVVLPYSLCVECLMSDDDKGMRPTKDPVVLLKKLDNVVKAGAYVGYSSAKLFQKERETLRAVDSVVDKEGTQNFWEGTINVERNFVQEEAKRCQASFEPIIGLSRQFAMTYFGNVQKKDLCSEFRGDRETCDIERFKKWLEVADKMKDALLVHSFPDVASTIETDWYTWQFVRIWWAWIIDWACRRNYSGPLIENQDISNDIYDMEYVAYLSRADGILTRDKSLVVPLAKAAFPDRDVFSCIEDVPKSYRTE